MSAELLRTPIPDLSAVREQKEGYREYSIDQGATLRSEQLVPITEYGLAGQAYYSRPNNATIEPVDGVAETLYVRKTVAEKLQVINKKLAASYITQFFEGEVELYIEDAHRSTALQDHLRNDVFPKLLRQRTPDISEQELHNQLDKLVAEPAPDTAHPSPHVTGGAVDVVLRYKQNDSHFVDGVDVYFGHQDGETTEIVYPDYFEHQKATSEEDMLAQRNRRAFYAIMTGSAFDFSTDFQVNPTEWWHWSYGDQMWAKLLGQPAALYGFVDKSA